MGKHSAPESPGFWRAVIIAGLRYLAILGLIAAVGFGVYKLAFDNSEPESPTDEDLTALPDDPFAEPTTDETTSPTPTASASPSAAATAGGRTQVLDASGSPARLDSADRKLRDAGYQVVAKGNASTPRERTTVFYQPGNQQLAEAVADLLGVALVQPVGSLRLDPSIPVTVILGPDYAG